ncbi:GNAT family N-acetyltransferase [Nocardioides zeae]|uniref:GNAT family N-acetyltransferase n=1 Tax=Nocardioides imazamoxiresistens TaxID=3231893 RepID=A0ABU3PWV4_9ACTN|nr:GNAT family N-acetyltransferase [Nocardioides zeae]MDT9593709.1 GNAT family N-acetyltransferase [Nocardioides zeae]
MLVRPLRAEDAGEVAAVGELTVRAYAPFLLGREDPYADRLRDVATRAREAEVWVAELDGVAVGSVTWCPDGSPWREVGRDDEGEFRMLAVDPAHQGRGVARALVAQCLDLARAEGRGGVALCSLPEQTGAHALYAGVGFERDPERDWSPVPGVALRAFALRF